MLAPFIASALFGTLALPSASPPPAVSEVDGVRFTLVSEQTCEDNKIRWWRYEPEAQSMATCARAAAAHEGCGTSIMWSVAAPGTWLGVGELGLGLALA